MSRSEIPEPEESFFLRCAQVRARSLGKYASEERLADVAARPWFRALVLHARGEGWMDAMIHEEERRDARRKS